MQILDVRIDKLKHFVFLNTLISTMYNFLSCVKSDIIFIKHYKIKQKLLLMLW